MFLLHDFVLDWDGCMMSLHYVYVWLLGNESINSKSSEENVL